MPLDSTHEAYSLRSSEWQRVRDVLAGEDAVKNEGETYLPKPRGQDLSEYSAYKMRAMFLEAVPRTIAGLVGAVFRKQPQIEIPEQQRGLLDDLTLTGVPFDIFAQQLLSEQLAIGRAGLLIDFPREGDRAYVRRYAAESILNWNVTTVGGRQVLDFVVLSETADDLTEDPFKPKKIDQIRLLSLEETENGPFYMQRVFQKRNETQRKEDWVLVDEVAPVRSGEFLNKIPFIFAGVNDLDPMPARSPMIGLVNVNLSHYRTSADLEHGSHYTALPTAWIAGADPEMQELDIGPPTIWKLPLGATAGMLEFTGQGLQALEQRLNAKRSEMAVLGARLLEDQKRGVEAAESLRIRHRGENSILANVTQVASAALTEALRWMVWWNGIDDPEVSVDLNTDFEIGRMTSSDLRELVAAWQSGAYPIDVLWENLREGEIIGDGWTNEGLRDALEQEPALGMIGMQPDAA